MELYYIYIYILRKIYKIINENLIDNFSLVEELLQYIGEYLIHVIMNTTQFMQFLPNFQQIHMILMTFK